MSPIRKAIQLQLPSKVFFEIPFQVPQVVCSWGILAPSFPRSRNFLLPRQSDRHRATRKDKTGPKLRRLCWSQNEHPRSTPSPASTGLSHDKGIVFFPFMEQTQLPLCYPLSAPQALPFRKWSLMVPSFFPDPQKFYFAATVGNLTAVSSC